MLKIFISYRRDDARETTERLTERLIAIFGRERVFKDVDSITPGINFHERLENSIQESGVFIAIIGRKWATLVDEKGMRRLTRRDDFVRSEIETAFSWKIPVIPLLVNGANLPEAEELPNSLRQLVRQQAAVLRADPDFQRDVDRLVNAIEKHGVRRKFAHTKLILALTGIMIAFCVGIMITMLRGHAVNQAEVRTKSTAVLISLIKDQIPFEYYEAVGGLDAIKEFHGTLTIRVRAPDHAEIYRLLSRLREARHLPIVPEPQDLSLSDPKFEALSRVLSERTEINFTDTPLSDGVSYLSDYHAVRILIDSEALADEGIATDSPVTRTLSDVSLRSALRILLQPLQLDFEIENGAIIITTASKLQDVLITKVYDVQDLIALPVSGDGT